MRNKYVFVAVMLCVILVIGMGLTSVYVNYSGTENEKDEMLIVTSFYPMYIAVENIVGDTKGVRVENLSEPQTGCLHDFQLTPEDMKLLSTADVFVINGGGIESFMEEVASAYPNLVIVEACSGLSLLSEEEEAHVHEPEQEEARESEQEEARESAQEEAWESAQEDAQEEEPMQEDEEAHEHGANAHAWMSVSAYRQMINTVAQGLGAADEAHQAFYMEHAKAYDEKLAVLQERQEAVAQAAFDAHVILFHEAYEYVAADYGMHVSYVMNLDEERQVSAGEVADVLTAIEEGSVSLILAEELYGAGMADTVQQETEVTVLYLDTLNRGSYDADSYLVGMEHNIEQLEAYFAD